MSKKLGLIEEEETPVNPHKSKGLLYFAFGLAALGAAMMVVPTILIFVPDLFVFTAQTMFKLPITWVAICGSVLLTVGLILHRKITTPMKIAETEKLRSRLE